jgi:hemerythrin superfamily protein
MNAIQLLRQQHAEVQSLFRRLRALDGDDPDEGEQLFAELADQLAAHSEVEERLFYPTVRLRALDTLLRHAVEDHLEAKHLLAELLEDADGGDFATRVRELEKVVLQHVHEEERKLLPRARVLFSHAELEAMGEEMEDLFLSLVERAPRYELPAQLA